MVAATNRDPQQAVDDGVLRADLYFRINVMRIDVPLLRERPEDIPLLAEHFLSQCALELGRPVPHLSAAALARLQAYGWPGNVRELENIMERAAVSVPRARGVADALACGSLRISFADSAARPVGPGHPWRCVRKSKAWRSN